MKFFLKTIGYSALAFIIFFGISVSAQLPSTQSVETLDATNVNVTNKTATISLSLSDGDFLKHGFAFRGISEIAGVVGVPSKSQIGNCVPDIDPGSDPYSENTYREQSKTELILGESYYYYTCAQSTTGTIIEGEIKSFSIGNELIQGCVVQNASFSEISGNGSFNGNAVVLMIQASGCNDGLTVHLKAINNTTHLLKKIDDIPLKIKPDAVGVIRLNLKTGEDTCFFGNRNPFGGNNWRKNCVSYVEIYNDTILEYTGSVPELNKQYVQGIGHSPERDVFLRGKGALVEDCHNNQSCKVGSPTANHENNWKYTNILSGSILQGGNQNCLITANDIKWTGLGFSSNGDVLIHNRTPRLHLNTSNCRNVPFSLLIEGYGIVNHDILSISALFAVEDEVVINFHASEYGCAMGWFPDCRYHVRINNEHITLGALQNSPYNCDSTNCSETWNQNLSFLNKGIILANCSGICSPWPSPWNIISLSGANYGQGNENPENIPTIPPVFDENSPCYVAANTPDSNGETRDSGRYDPNCYEFLAPIPGIGEQSGDRWYIDNLKEYRLGDYIQQIFNAALGILMVLAVIMLVIAGVQYMTVEGFHGKTDAKGKITGAIAGLILALGIFLILQTINPRLLEINFGKDIQTATLGIVNDPGEQDSNVSSGSVSNAPPTNICTNRKDRGYWPGQNSLKLQAIAQTAQTINLQDLEGDISVKPGTPQGTNIKYHVEETFADKLISFKNTLQSQSIQIEATETFGPTFLGHGSPCHYLASCIDLATQDRQYPVDTVEKIIRAADSNGLTAHFEFSKTQSIQEYQTMQNELFSRGIDKCMVLYVRHATAWHFSIYDKADESLSL